MIPVPDDLAVGLGNRGRRIIQHALSHKILVTRDGNVWHFRGPGVDISTTVPGSLSEAELQPAPPMQRFK